MREAGGETATVGELEGAAEAVVEGELQVAETHQNPNKTEAVEVVVRSEQGKKPFHFDLNLPALV